MKGTMNEAGTVWGYHAGYAVRLSELEARYELEPGELFPANPHLKDVCLARAGDLVFIPIEAEDKSDLRELFPYQPEFMLEDLEEISTYEAGLVQSGALRLKNNSENFIEIDQELLQTIMNRCAGVTIHSKLDLTKVGDALNRAMRLAEAASRKREVAFLSQAVIETDYFRTFEEYGKGAGHAYGNYYGRGMHQLTWQQTYAACSKAVFNDDRLVKHPEQIVNDIEVNIKATAWYWRDYKAFNTLADHEDIDEIIHKLYGGTMQSASAQVRHSVELRRGYYITIRMALNQRHDQRI